MIFIQSVFVENFLSSVLGPIFDFAGIFQRSNINFEF